MSASMILPGPMPAKQEKTASIGLRNTRLNRVSAKMRKALVEYAKVKLIWWAARLEIDGGRCQFTDEAGNRCPKQASPCPHHVYGRGKYLCDPSTFLAVCNQDHNWIENNKRTARARGLIRYQ